MCGLAFYFAKESVPPLRYFDKLFSWAEKRGTDGFGLVIVKRNVTPKPPIPVCNVFKNVNNYSKCKYKALDFVEEHLEVGDVLLAICRAAPEQEPPTTEQNMQPIWTGNCILIHNGSVSQKIYNEIMSEREEKKQSVKVSKIDSEAIIHAYVQAGRDIQKTMERISGGVAAIMYDHNKDMVYMMNDFKPTAQAYIKGYGYFLASDNECLGEIIEELTSCTRDGVCLWENFYHHYLSGGRIKELDLDSGFVRNIKYRPRYMTQHWDSNAIREGEDVCLVSASGGLDSTLTMAILKLAQLNPVACHFKYGHRGQDAEEKAITTVCDQMSIPLKVFDIEQLVRGIDPSSMLIDPNAKITTGTTEGLKKLDAWVCGRNMIFLTLMATYAEALVMKENHQNVYFVGGFLNLTESGHYPDNSEYFLSSALEHFKYGTLIGHRIKPMFCLSNLMKSDQFALIKAFGLEDIYRHTISCDRPIVDENGIPRNCSKNGVPACGSGLLSYWASKMVGMDDMQMRNFYEVEEEYEPHVPDHLSEGKVLEKDIDQIIDRILIPKANRALLKDILTEI